MVGIYIDKFSEMDFIWGKFIGILQNQNTKSVFYKKKELGVKMEKLLTFLSETDLFYGISKEQIREEILPAGQIQEFPKDTYVLEPNDKLEYFGIVLEGSIQILHIFSDGNSSIIRKLKPGRMYGSDLIFTRSRIAPYHVRTVSKVRMMTFPTTLLMESGHLSEEIRQKMKDHLLEMISQNNMRREYRLAILSQKGLRERILTYLTMQANRRGSNTFQIPFSREEMATYLCVNRSALSHELGLMQKEGLITFHKNQFTLIGF